MIGKQNFEQRNTSAIFRIRMANSRNVTVAKSAFIFTISTTRRAGNVVFSGIGKDF
jgi:hypothetical protein